MKKRLFPNSRDSPAAVLDAHGNLITDSTGIMNRMSEEFAFRLRNREECEGFQELREMKEKLCKLRLQITSNAKYIEWTMEDLEKVLNKLKKDKAKDPHGHINELYKNIGTDGKISLLLMMNQIKREIVVPSKLDLSDVTTLYKGKGTKQDVVNWRGIFQLPIVRNILDKLVYEEEYDKVAKEMGSFQVGSQRGRNIRDHTLVLHAVANEARMKNIDIDITLYDIGQAFDSIWLQEALNDLYQSGVKNRNLNILYSGNSKTRMSVKTSFGATDRVTLETLVMQGAIPGPIFCSNQLSKNSNKNYNEGTVYMYMNSVPIPVSYTHLTLPTKREV